MKKIRCPICNSSFTSQRNLESHMSLRHPESFEITTISNNYKRSSDISIKKKKKIVVDGNNISYLNTNRPRFNTIVRVRDLLIRHDYDPQIIVSARLKYVIDEPDKLNQFIRDGLIIESDSGSDDDLEVILLAKHHKCFIVSNDNYLEYREEFPWIPSSLKKVRLSGKRLVIS